MDVVCPHCKVNYLNVPSQYEGRTIRCKKCGNAFLLQRANESKGVVVEQTVASASEKTPRTGDSSATGVLRRLGAESRDEWMEGDLILDLYEVKKLLGEGAMGKVFRIRHREWDMDLAVKTPKVKILEKAGGVEDFEREAETWVNLGLHPHIVSCYYARRIGEIPRIFVDYVEGGSLADWIGERKLYEGGPEKSLERMLNVAIQFAWGLHYAHDQGLIHQDVKPGNVMMTPEGTVKVTDFGLARAGAMSETDSTGTSDATMVVKGVGLTPAYASPEQLERRSLTRRSDLWSWGLSVLEMFAGRRTWPVGSVAAGALEDYLTSGAMDPEIPRMPAHLEELLRRCFRENPEERPHDLKEIADALREIYREAVGRAFPRPEPKAGSGTADSLHNRAVSLLDLGRVEDAERLWEEAVRVEPHHPEATYGRGLRLWRSGRISDLDLVRDMDGVIKSHQDRWIASYLFALVHLERGDYRAAKGLLESAKTAGGDTGAIRQAMERAKNIDVYSIMPDDHIAPASVSFSRDGRFLLTASDDKTIRLRDIASGRCVRTFEGHDGKVKSACLTPDNRFVVSACEDGTLRVWDVGSGSCIRVLRGYSSGLSLSGDGRFMLSGIADQATKVLTLWEIDSGRCVRRFGPSEGELRGVSLSADGRRALSFGRLGYFYLRLWNTESGECLVDFVVKETRLNEMQLGSLSKDGRHLLRNDVEKLAWWEIGAEQPLRIFEGHSQPVTSAVLSEDNRLALSGSADCTVKLWEVESGRCLRTLEHGAAVLSVSLRRDSKVAASTGIDSTLKLWDVSTGRCLQTVDWTPIRLDSVFLSRDGHRALAAKSGESFDLWDTKSRRRLRLLTTSIDPDSPSSNAVSSDEDGRLAVRGTGVGGHTEGALTVWDMETGKQVRSFSENTDPVRCLSLVRNGRYVMVGRTAGSGMGNHFAPELWDLESERCVRTFEGHTKAVSSVFLSPDSRLALSGSYDLTVKLWEVSTARCIRTFEGHTEEIHFVCLSEDGRYVLSAGCDGTLRVWEVAGGHCLRVIEAGKGSMFLSCAISPAGSFVITAPPLRLWEVPTGRCLRSFEDQKSPSTSVSLSRDGAKLLSGSGDTMRLLSTSFAVQPYKAPLMLTRVTRGEEALGIQSKYEARLESAQAAMDRGDAAEAASLLRSARGLPGYGRAADAMALWQNLYLHLSIRGFRGAWEVPSFQEREGLLSGISLSADGSYALTSSRSKAIRLWETATGKCLREFHGHGFEVWWSMCLSEDNTLALAAGDSRNRDNKHAAGLWDTATGRCVCSFECNGVYSVCLSRSKRRALLVGILQPMSLYDARTGRLLQLFEKSGSKSAFLTPDENYALSGFGNTIKQWEISTGQCVRTFEGHHDEVYSLSTDAAGRFVLSAGRDGTLKLWDIATGACVQTMEGIPPESIVSSLSMNGKYVLSGEPDGSIRIWDAASGVCLHGFRAHMKPVVALALCRDNRFAMSASINGELKLWVLDWELEDRPAVDWDEEAQPHLDLFHNWSASICAFPERSASHPWTEEDFQRLLHTLGCSGYGYIRAEGVRKRLEAMCRPYEEHLAAAREALDRGDFIEAAGKIRLARSVPGFELGPEAFDLWSRLYEIFPRKGLRKVVQGPFFSDGHQSEVRSLCLSRDGWHAMSGNMANGQGAGDVVKVWDVRTGSCLRTFDGCSIPSGSGCLSVGGSRAVLYCGDFCAFDTRNGELLYKISPPQGDLADRSLATLSWEDRLQFLLDAEGGHLQRLTKENAEKVRCTCLSRDERFALSGDYSGTTAKYWLLDTGMPLRTLEGHESTVMSVCFSADDCRALTGSADKTLRLWDLKSGQCLQVFTGHEGIVTSVCLSEDGRYALSGSLDRTVKLWETNGGRCIWTSHTMRKAVHAVAFTPNGRHILAGDANGDITLRLLDWELEEREPSDWDPGAAPFLEVFLNRLDRVVLYDKIDEAEHNLDSVLSQWTEDTLPAILHVLGCSGFGFLRREGVQRALSEAITRRKDGWEFALITRRYHLSLAAANAAFDGGNMPEAARLLRVCRSWHIFYADPEAMDLWGRLSLHLPLKGLVRGIPINRVTDLYEPVNAVAFTPDGRRIVSASNTYKQSSIGIWDVRSGRFLWHLGVSEMGPVRTISLSLDGTLLLSGHGSGNLYLWELKSGTLISRKKTAGIGAHSTCLFPDGSLAAITCEKSIDLVDVARSLTIGSIEIPLEYSASCLAVSRDGQFLLSGTRNGMIILWDVQSLRRLRLYSGHTDVVDDVSFSPDGRRMVSGSSDGTIRLWDLETGNCLQTVMVHAGVTGVSFFSDGKHCASGSINKTVMIWDLESAQCLQTFETHTDAVLSVCTSPINSHVVSGSSDKTTCLYQLDWELDA